MGGGEARIAAQHGKVRERAFFCTLSGLLGKIDGQRED